MKAQLDEAHALLKECSVDLWTRHSVRPLALKVRAFLSLPAEEAPDMVLVPLEVIKFLRGIGKLESCAFGEKPNPTDGTFWWRKYLSAAQNAEKERK